jgi:hypothetical protein
VIPNTVFGLLVLAASLGPGYVFVRVAERREPRPARSSLLEIAELVTVGGSCSAVTLMVGLIVAHWLGWVDLSRLGSGGTDYALTHPARVFSLALAVFAASLLASWRLSVVLHRGLPATLHQHSVWHQLMRRQEEGAAFATVELRDGRTVAGPVAYYTVQEASPEDRELVLIAPIRARRNDDADYEPVTDSRVVLRASDMVALSVKYF